jgi:hypothetical protein
MFGCSSLQNAQQALTIRGAQEVAYGHKDTVEKNEKHSFPIY